MALPPLLPSIDNLSGDAMAKAILEMAVGRRPKDMQFDRNGDGRLTSADALNYLKAFRQQETDRQAQAENILKMAVGRMPKDMQYDMNGDGRITSADALAYRKGAQPVQQAPALTGTSMPPLSPPPTAPVAPVADVQPAPASVPNPITNPEFFPSMPTPQEAEAARLRNLEQQRATGSLDTAYFGPGPGQIDPMQQQQRDAQARALEGMAATNPQNVDLTAPANNPFTTVPSSPNSSEVLAPEVNPALLAQVDAYFQNQGKENVQALQRMRAAQLQAMLPSRTPSEAYGYGQPFNPQAMNLTSPQNNPYMAPGQITSQPFNTFRPQPGPGQITSQPFNTFTQQRMMANQPFQQPSLQNPQAYYTSQPMTSPRSQPRQNFFNPPQQNSFFNRNLPQQPKGTFSPTSETSPFTQDQSGQTTQQNQNNQNTTQNQSSRPYRPLGGRLF